EESSGAGGTALVDRGLRADAGIVTQPTRFTVWGACRGPGDARIPVPRPPRPAQGRAPAWQAGGAVHPTAKGRAGPAGIATLRSEWANREGFDHPFLSRPDLVPTMARSGEWPVTYPSECALTIAVMFLPSQADVHGWGADVRREVEQWIVSESARDDWLAEHP